MTDSDSGTRILKLTASNVKRLAAVEIQPSGNVVVVGGKNGAAAPDLLEAAYCTFVSGRSPCLKPAGCFLSPGVLPGVMASPWSGPDSPIRDAGSSPAGANETCLKETNTMQDTHELTGQYVIARCHDAGVHAGYLVSWDARAVVLRDSRRLWRWWSKFTLSGLATDGPLPSKANEQVYSCVIPTIYLRTSDVCEIIPCTDRARRLIEAVPEHKND